MGDDVRRWLEELGLGHYAAVFAENDIDLEVLPDLTERDLEKLGVSLGHRKRLLRAIAAAPAAPGPVAPVEAERRQLTVVFCDLVGSTELSARLDPEDLRDVIRAYHRCAAEVVERYEGHVSKFLGDGVLAHFGHPRAHEDDAERAVRAGLDLVEAVGALAPCGGGVRLQVRVGIATGLVVVGDLVGPGAEWEQAVVGRTPNLAARLQMLAEPNTVVISRRTRRLVGGLFDLVDLGERELKGFAEPVPAWRVLGPSAAEGRFEAREAAGLTPLVGREHELGLLLDRWERAKEGEGQVVLLAGEPGIGKSRLVQTLRARLEQEPHARIGHACSPFHTSSTLYPVVDQLGRAAGLRRDDPPGRKLDKLEALLARSIDDAAAVAPLFADLLSIPTDGRYPPLDLGPQRRKERLYEALLSQIEGPAARRQPVLYVFEDVHWIDPTSLEFLGLAVDRVQRLPVLVVITFRPDFQPPWTGRAHATMLTLNRLGRREVAALVDRVTGGKPLPSEVVGQIAAKTDGVPLFVEELTKAVLESGLLREVDDHYEHEGPLPPLAIPSTLRDSLVARLDRLAPVKEVAQVAAVIGREFPHELLAAVAPLGGDALNRALDQLVEATLVFRRGSPPEATYSFKHALVQDAAYQSLLTSRRQQLHARIASVLEERFPEQRERQPELLARHFTEAGLTDKAIDYWRNAGRRAVARSAAVEAVAHFTRALDLLGHGAEEAASAKAPLEAELQLALGGALIQAKGFAAPETGLCYRRARDLARRTGDAQHLLMALLGEYTFHLLRAELDRSQAVAEEMLDLARARGNDPTPRLMAHRALGTNAFASGHFVAARDDLERLLALYDPVVHRPLTLLSGYDIRVPTRGYLCLVLFILGYPDRARASFHKVLAEARPLSQLYSVCHALHYACTMHKFLHDIDGVREAAEALLAVATEQGFPLWVALARVNRGWARAAVAGDGVEAGIEEIRQGLSEYRATGAEYLLTHFLGMLAEATGAAGRVDEALGVLTEALAQVDKTGERCLEAELHRLRGELLLAHAPSAATGEEEAEAALRRALVVAREQGAGTWELRAATSLARLWRDRDRRAEARDLLTPVYARFTEGFDTKDLRDARALLAEIAA